MRPEKWTPFDDLLVAIWLFSDEEMEVLRDKLVERGEWAVEVDEWTSSLLDQ